MGRKRSSFIAPGAFLCIHKWYLHEEQGRNVLEIKQFFVNEVCHANGRVISGKKRSASSRIERRIFFWVDAKKICLDNSVAFFPLLGRNASLA